MLLQLQAGVLKVRIVQQVVPLPVLQPQQSHAQQVQQLRLLPLQADDLAVLLLTVLRLQQCQAQPQ
jgi:hypothetical protein